jgi:1A family penicillin-binding protein
MDKHKRRRGNWLKKYIKERGWFKGILSLGLWLVFAGIVFVLLIFLYFAKDLPNPEKLSERQVVQSTKIYDRTGTVLLYDIHGEEKRTIIPFDQMPAAIKEAALVTEDANFYHHFGLDFKGILRALWSDLTGGKLSQGGSTITQQYIKSSFLTPEKTFSRKIKEAILSIELEIKYPKDKIFEAYLNQIPYGSNAYGIEAAAETFFNKPAKDLTLAESALLAGLPRAPSYYSPYGSHLDALKSRQEYILDRLVEFNYITKVQAEQAKKEKLVFAPPKDSIKAPHFVMYVKEYLEAKYGQDMVEKGGLKVYTTLDWPLEQLAEETIAKDVKSNEKKYRAYNGALVAIDPKTGQILAMVGSKDYFADPLPAGCTPGQDCRFEPNVNVAIRDRQPGSSFKPFAYSLAFKKGYTPQTILFDLPTEFNASCPSSAGYANYQGNVCYNPQNYDGKFRGPVTMREALAQSLNIPSVETLYLAGINQTINLSQDMGITTLKDRSRYGLALVLGGGEVKLLDMVSGYSVFANDGIKNPETPILKIEAGDGKILEKWENQPSKILDPEIARTISGILSDNSARAPVFGSTSPLYLGARPAAVKTGTTQENKDAWTIGYTPSLAVGIWTGNNDNSPMTKEGAGIQAAGPIWNEFMKNAYELKIKNNQTYDAKNPFAEKNSEPAIGQGFPAFSLPGQIEEFTKPEPVITSKSILNGQAFNEKTYKIDRVSGLLATDLTPPELIEEKSFKEAHCILYYVDKNNPRGDLPQNPQNDPQFANWEAPVLAWAKGQTNNQQPDQKPPTEYDTVHNEANQPQVKIISPLNGDNISSWLIKIRASASAALGIKQVDFFFDDNFIGTASNEPYDLLFNVPLDAETGEHTIKARAYDQALNRQEDEISVLINIPPPH